VVGNNGVGNIYEWKGEFSSPNGFAANDPIVSNIPYVSVGKNGSSIAVNGGNQINIVEKGCISKGDVFPIDVPNNDVLSSLTGLWYNYYLGLTSPSNGNQTAYLVQYTDPSNNYIVKLGTLPENEYHFASGGGYAALTSLQKLYLVNSSGVLTVYSTPDKSNIVSLKMISAGECTVTTALGDIYNLLPGSTQFVADNLSGKWFMGDNLFYQIESNGDEQLTFTWIGAKELATYVQANNGNNPMIPLGGLQGAPSYFTKDDTYSIVIPKLLRNGVIYTSVGGSQYSAFPISPTATICGDGVLFKLNPNDSEQIIFTWTGSNENASYVLANSPQCNETIPLGGLSGAPASDQNFIQGDTYSITLPLSATHGNFFTNVGGELYSKIPPWIPGDGIVYQLRSNGDEIISFNWTSSDQYASYIQASSKQCSQMIPLVGLVGAPLSNQDFVQGDTYTITIPADIRKDNVYTSIGGTTYSSDPPNWNYGNGVAYRIDGNGDEEMNFTWIAPTQVAGITLAYYGSTPADDNLLGYLIQTMSASAEFVQGDTYTISIPANMLNGEIYKSVGGMAFSSIPEYQLN